MNNNELEELINAYRTNKQDVDDLKKVVDRQNKEIKDIMLEEDLKEFTTYNNYTAKIIVTEKDTMNEELLLSRLQVVKDKYPNLIKTREYVDLDELENLVYNNLLDDNTTAKVNSCITTKEVIQLRISKKKGE